MHTIGAEQDRTDARQETALRRATAWSLALIVAGQSLAGLQAAIAPRAFFDDFPLGRGWVSGGDASYDEHTVRDVGVLLLALSLATIVTLRQRTGRDAVAAAWLFQGTLHLVFHAGHLDGLGTVDRFGLVLSLASVPALALVALWSNRTVEP
jgi:hypothetical protein